MAARRALDRIAAVPLSVLILGETGTGKELAARHVHRHSRQHGGPFVAVNCAAIPGHLAESELFGHVKGAFTGAHRGHTGAFARADGGTLFLDEVGELPPDVQAKLLRVLETGHIAPIGSERDVPVEVRLVSATHRNLAGMVAKGSFREDLLHRLGVVTVELPPLRERLEDIPLLLEHFVAEANRRFGTRAQLAPDCARAAMKRDWPGNVRGLRNAVFRAAALAEGPIQANDLAGAPLARRGAGAELVVPRGDYASMRRSILRSVVAQEGSIRRAAQVLRIPRTTLGNWLKQ